MTEDSGTFKTYQAGLRRICRFVIRKTTVAPLHHGVEIASLSQLPESSARIFGNAGGALRYGRISLIRHRFELRSPRGERGNQ